MNKTKKQFRMPTSFTILFTLIFISLSLIIIFLLRRQIKMVPYLYDSTDPLFHTKK